MSAFVPDIGSMYRTLRDRCVDVFKIGSLPEILMYGDPGGFRCHGNWDCDDWFIAIQTPQLYRHNPFRLRNKELHGWPFFRDFASPTTGFLSVSRIVKTSSPHFEWVDPPSIISSFDLSFSQTDADAARNMVVAFCADTDWLSPKFTPDGSYQLVRGSISHPLAIRFATLLRNTNAHLVVWEMQSIAGLDGFYDQSAFGGWDLRKFVSRFSGSYRLEFLGYEFELTGKSSWDFQIVK